MANELRKNRKRGRNPTAFVNLVREWRLGDRQEITDLFVLAQQLLPKVVPPGNVLAVRQRAFDPIVSVSKSQIENACAFLQPRAIFRGPDRLIYYSSSSGHDAYTNPIISDPPLRDGVRGFASLLQTLDQCRRITSTQFVNRLTEHLLRLLVQFVV